MSNFLDLPIEIRLKIYLLLLAGRSLKVEGHPVPNSSDYCEAQRTLSSFSTGPLETVLTGRDTHPGPAPPWRMKPVPDVHAHILQASQLIYSEAYHLLYSHNIFDCSDRDALVLLQETIGPANFTLVESIILDWDQIEPFNWSLNRNDADLYANLKSIDLGTWRTRILGGKSPMWQQSKSYERQLCLAAAGILQKHPTLTILAQRSHHKAPLNARTNNSSRVKWRFVAEGSKLGYGECIVDLEKELEMLCPLEGDHERQAAHLMLDPF